MARANGSRLCHRSDIKFQDTGRYHPAPVCLTLLMSALKKNTSVPEFSPGALLDRDHSILAFNERVLDLSLIHISEPTRPY